MTPTRWTRLRRTLPFSASEAPAPALLLMLVGGLGVGCAAKDDGPKDPGNEAVPSDYDEDAISELPEGSPDQDHDGWTVAAGDCDDNNGAIHPDHDEVCDGFDNNCDGVADEGFDLDNDGHLPLTCATGDDCDDSNSRISPSTPEIPYDGIDQDCSGADSLDADEDGFDSIDYGGNDCNDNDPATFPGAPEVAKDGLDQDCDGLDSLDEDLDGWDDVDYGGLDCDDLDPTINPGAFDWFNDPEGIDHDCDGDDGVPTDMNDGQMVVSGTVSRGDYLGYSADSCDLNADGYDDFLVGAPLANSNRGEVGLFFGSSYKNWTSSYTMVDADIVFTGSRVGFGMHVRCGDVNGDGLDDLVLARAEYGRYYDYEINVFYGDTTWASSYSADEAHAKLTLDLGGTGSTIYGYQFELEDLDGDGVDELFFFAPTGSLTGPDLDDAIWIVQGGSTFEGEMALTDVVDRRIYPTAIDTFTGMSVEPDLNGDGERELVLRMGVATDTSGAASGRVSFLSGMPSGSDTVENLEWASVVGTPGVESATGYDVSFADLDGDGAHDMVVGVPLADAGSRTDVGELAVISDVVSSLTGTELEVASLTDYTVTGGYSSGLLGYATHAVGDLDEDGYDDIFAVEPGAGTGGRGRSTVLSGALVSSGEEYVENGRLVELTHPNGYTGVAQNAGIADFDGDGHPDYWINAPSYGRNSAGSGYDTGRVYIFTSSTYTHATP